MRSASDGTTSLSLLDLYADISVRTHPGRDVIVNVVSDPAGDTKVDQEGPATVVRGPRPGRGAFSINGMQIGPDGSVHAGRSISNVKVLKINGRTLINGQEVPPGPRPGPARIDVLVPVGTDIKIRRVDGPVLIQEAGIVDAKTSGSSTIDVDRATALQVAITGSGFCQAHRVDGPVNASITGSGRVIVGAGDHPHATATVTGSGSIRISGICATAVLSTAGSGSVYADHVRQEPRRRSTGSGKVHVSRIG